MDDTLPHPSTVCPTCPARTRAHDQRARHAHADRMMSKLIVIIALVGVLGLQGAALYLASLNIPVPQHFYDLNVALVGLILVTVSPRVVEALKEWKK